MSLDPHQRRAVEAPASVAVVAGAGTGKTHMLARRYLRHLTHDGLRPLEVVAVTFTRRAADELRARIRSVVRDALSDGQGGVDGDALLEVEAAPIGTIHALAQRVCHAFPEEAGLPPDVRVLDELDGRLWTAEALDAALDGLEERAVRALPFSLLKGALQALLADPYRAELALAKDRDALRRELREARRAELERVLGAGWDDALATLAAASGPADHPTERARRDALAAALALSGDGADDGWGDGATDAAADATGDAPWRILADLKPHLGRAAEWRGTGAASGVDVAAVKAALRTVRDAAREAWADGRGPATWRWGPLDDTLLQRTEAVRTAFARVRTDLAARKRRAKQVDFGDLEVHALRALEQPHVRDALRRRWRAVLVDEFQDTSPAQARLLELLRGDAPTTFVGDEKQSIYAFRGADVRVFRSERERLARRPGAVTVELGTSYRTHHGLVEAVNRVFDAVLGDAAAPLDAARRETPLAGPHVRWLSLDATGLDAPAAATAEAERIARTVAALLDATPPVEVEVDGVRRPLRAGDVAVLARSRTSLEALEAVAPALGVPVLNAGGGDVLATREGLDALALLTAVTDPSHAPAVLAVLRGPLVAASDAAIHELAAGPSRPSPRWWRRLERSDDARVRAGAALLADLRSRHARGAGAAALLRAADRATGVRAVLANLPDAARRLADWDGVVELVERLEGGAGDAFAVVRRLQRLRAAQVAVPRPPLRSSDAVSLLSVHASKGLEWPVVIVLDLARRARPVGDEVVIDPELGVTLRWRDAERAWLEPALHRLAEHRQARAAAAEDARLAYVALTRARDLLVLSDRGGRGGLRATLAPGLAAAGVEPEAAVVEGDAASGLPPLPVGPVGDAVAPDPVSADTTAGPLWANGPSATAASVAALPDADPFAGAPLFERSPSDAAAAWDRVAAALAVLDEEGIWHAVVAAAVGAGVPAPPPSDVFARMTLPGGAVADVPLRWAAAGVGPGVALVEREALEAGGDAAAGDAAAGSEPPLVVDGAGWRWVGVDPGDPDAAVAALGRALGVGDHDPRDG